ncbi:MAG: BspA family leucine-rich repeat surface protein [Anaerolineaceae bacterium]|nr:BspA family leucine-rich repeat surface protein [Anaerolineaceae bacterium]
MKRFGNLFLICLIMLLVICSHAFAQTSGTCGSGLIKWEIVDGNTIRFSANNYDKPLWNTSSCGDALIKNNPDIKIVWIDDEIRISFQRAFYGYSNVKEMHFSNFISNNAQMSEAFSGCTSLETFDAPDMDVSNVTDMYNLFDGCSALKTADLSGWNISSLTRTVYMFDGCSLLETVDLSGWNTSKVTDMSNMFKNCGKLSTVTVGNNWTTESVKDMQYMFIGCSSLTDDTLAGMNIKNWNTSNVTTTSHMFDGCSSLVNVDLSGWNTPALTTLGYMFQNCTKLESLNIRNWNTSNLSTQSSGKRNAFTGCNALSTVTLGENSIKNNIFYRTSTDRLPQYSGPWYYLDPDPEIVSDDPLPVGTTKTGASLFTGYTPSTMAGTWTTIPLLSITLNNVDEGGISDSSYSYDSTEKTYTKYFTKDSPAITLPEPEKTGYTFLGWTGEGITEPQVTVTIPAGTEESKEYNANWRVHAYTVEFNGNGSTSGSMDTQDFEYDEEKKLTANSFTRSYTITYDYRGATGGNEKASDTLSAAFNGWALTSSGDVEYTDQQTVKNLTDEYDITIDLYANWGDFAAVTLPSPTKPYSTFAGWYWDEAGEHHKAGDAGASYTPDADRTLYAKWITDINAPSIIISPSPIPDQEYTGDPIEPAVTIHDGETLLKEGSDYTITYSKNTDAGENTAVITIKGKGNYNGERTLNFTIKPKPVKITSTAAADRDYQEGDTGVEISSVTFADAASADVPLVPGTDFTVTGEMEDDSAGTDKKVTVTVTLTNPNYTLDPNTAETTVTINKIPYPGPALSLDKYVYVNLAQTGVETDLTDTLSGIAGAAVTSAEETSDPDSLVSNVKTSGSKVIFDTASVAEKDKTAMITAQVSADNYTDVTVTVNVITTDKDDAGVSIAGGNQSVTWGDTGVVLTAEAAFPGTPGTGVWNWISASTDIAEIDSTTGELTIHKVGATRITAQYESDTTIGTMTIILTVKSKTIDIPEAVSGLKWTGEPQTGVPEGEGYTLSGNVETAPGNYTAEASLIDPVNMVWEDGTAEPKQISWNIEKADGPAAPALTGTAPTSEADDDGIISGCSPEMEYSLTPDFSQPISCTGTEITGLPAGTYYVRYKETATHKAGETDAVTVPPYDAPEQAASPVFSPAGGSYTGQQSVTITCETEGAVIHYTTDGTEPTADSPVYSGPIPVTESLTIKAVAVKDGLADSPVVSAVYTILPVPKSYTVTVENGTGSGSYTAGTVVSITADAAPAGETFDRWTSDDGVEFADESSASTSFVMPAKDVTVTAAYKGEPMTLNVVFVNIDQSSSYGVPKEFPSLELTGLEISIDAGDYESKTEKFTLKLTAGQSTVPLVLQFDRKVEQLAPGSHPVAISGLPEAVYGTLSGISLTEPPAGEVILWKYMLSARTEINEKTDESGKKIVYIRIYLTWDNGSSMPDEPVVRALPEDEIGAYKLNEDGTKEYLLFHTYSICMDWLGHDELCRGYERCFHKENPYINPFVTP